MVLLKRKPTPPTLMVPQNSPTCSSSLSSLSWDNQTLHGSQGYCPLQSPTEKRRRKALEESRDADNGTKGAIQFPDNGDFGYVGFRFRSPPPAVAAAARTRSRRGGSSTSPTKKSKTHKKRAIPSPPPGPRPSLESSGVEGGAKGGGGSPRALERGRYL